MNHPRRVRVHRTGIHINADIRKLPIAVQEYIHDIVTERDRLKRLVEEQEAELAVIDQRLRGPGKNSPKHSFRLGYLKDFSGSISLINLDTMAYVGNVKDVQLYAASPDGVTVRFRLGGSE